jgi:hypothetical protein
MRHDDEILGLLPRLTIGRDAHFGLWLLLFELLFWIAVVALTLALMRFRPMLLVKAEEALARISRYQRTWMITLCLAVVVIRVGLLPWVPVPLPTVHDEFSFLVGADTFAQGRVTNPPHPMGVHFESFHINILPTYQSMYPTAQALVLAVGQKLTGVPWTGVVLSTGLMCSAIYWMLLGWLPAPWALLGGLFAVVRFGIFSYWINTYFGGSVAAIGGALVLGALPRLRERLSAQALVVLAVGLLILATSRPLEGFVFSLPILAAVVFLIVKSGAWRSTAKRLLPAVALLLAGTAGQLYYNWRGTGHPLLMPYVLNYRTYHISKPFLFLKSNPIPQYTHPAMRTFYVFHEYADVVRLRFNKKEALEYMLRLKGATFYNFYVWPFLLLLAPATYRMFRDRDFRIVLITVSGLGLLLALEMWPSEAHYASPGTGAAILLVLYSLRHFRNSHLAYGAWATRAMAVLMAMWMLSPVAERVRNPLSVLPTDSWPMTAEEKLAAKRDGFFVPLALSRERIKSDLESRRGKQLVIVHHGYHDVPTIDWVYNAADIDHSKVIWARDMGFLKNQELIAYYPDRQVWYVDRGDPIARIIPYDQAMIPWKLALEKFDSGHEPELQNARLEQDLKRSPGDTMRLIPASISRSPLRSSETQTSETQHAGQEK